MDTDDIAFNLTLGERLPEFRYYIYRQIEEGERGKLVAIEGKRVPFPIRRVFFIYDVQPGQERGDHANRTCHEMIFPVCGGFTAIIDDNQGNHAELVLVTPYLGIHIPPGVFITLKDFTEDAVCLVLASEPYDENDKIPRLEARQEIAIPA